MCVFLVFYRIRKMKNSVAHYEIAYRRSWDRKHTKKIEEKKNSLSSADGVVD